MNNTELPMPPSASRDPEAIELLRVWAAQGEQHVSIRAGAWEDPAAWGILLVDLARHIANSFTAQGQDPTTALRRLRSGFDAEWDAPTDNVQDG